jgi:glutathione S-transferase
MSEITLYWNIVSQPSRAVKSLIDIGKIPSTLQVVDLFKQEHKKKEFQDMYVIGKVPVLKAGDFVLGESGAIMIYLCERYPHIVKYYGETLEQRAITNQYISWYQNFFRPFMIGPIRLLRNALLNK